MQARPVCMCRTQAGTAALLEMNDLIQPPVCCAKLEGFVLSDIAWDKPNKSQCKPQPSKLCFPRKRT